MMTDFNHLYFALNNTLTTLNCTESSARQCSVYLFFVVGGTKWGGGGKHFVRVIDVKQNPTAPSSAASPLMQHAVVPTSSASQLFVNNNCTLFTFQSLVLMNAGTTRWETLSCRSKWTPSGAKSNGHELCKKVCGCIHTAVHWAEMCHNL